MTLLKKIFSKIFTSTNPSKKQVLKNLDRAPRIALATLSESDPEVVMECASVPSTPLVRIVNISASGLALVATQALREFKMGSLITGRIRLSRKDGSVRAIDVVCEIRRIDDEVIGCSVRDGVLDLRQALEEHFAAALAAIELAPVSPKILAADPDGQPHLYRGSRGTELFFVTDEQDQILRFEMGFLGRFVSGGRQDSRLMMGVVLNDHEEMDRDHKPKPRGSHIVSDYVPMDSEVRTLAGTFVRLTRGIDGRYVDQLLTILNTYS